MATLKEGTCSWYMYHVMDKYLPEVNKWDNDKVIEKFNEEFPDTKYLSLIHI